jgi:Caspase domain
MEVNGKNYLIPVDAKLESTTALAFEVVDANVILNIMVEEKRVSIALLDACRDNPLARSFKKKSRSAVGSGLADVKVGQVGGGGLLYGLATGPGDTAADGDGRNSPFTKALLKHIATPGVEFEQMMKSVKRDVDAETKGDQRPYLTSSLIDDLFLVPAEKPVKAATIIGQDNDAAADWSFVKSTKSIALLNSFIAKHGADPLYRGLAEERIVFLTPEQIVVAKPDVPAKAVKKKIEEIHPTTRRVQLGKWPEGLAVGQDNTIWVAESGARQIVLVNPAEGKVKLKVPVGRLPVSMTSDRHGTVFAGVFTDGKIWGQSPQGEGQHIWQLPSKAHVLIDVKAADKSVFVAHYTDAPDRMTTLSRIDSPGGKAKSSLPFVGEGRALVTANGAAWLLMSNGFLAKFDLVSLKYQTGSDSQFFLWSLAANAKAVYTGGKIAQTPEGTSLVNRLDINYPHERIERSIEGNELIVTLAATDKHVVALGENGNVWVLDATDLTVLKHFNTGVPPRAALIHDGKLFVTSHQGDGENGTLIIYEDVFG